MAGNFDLPPWLTTQTPWSGSDAFIKGSQAGSAIAANRLRAKQLYVEVQQNQHRMDLEERQFAVENESATLRNEVARTKMANDAADFEALRKWYPEFLKSDGDMAPPILYNENAMLKVSSEIATKRSKVGMAAFAAFMAEPGRDLNRPEDRVKYYDLLAKYQNIPDKLGPDGIMAPIKMAESLKRLRDEADSRIASREDRTEYNAARFELQTLLADSTIDVNDARVLKLNNEVNMMEREMGVREGNLRLRGVELEQKGKRLSLRDSVSYKNELKTLNDEEAAKLQLAVGDPAESDRLRKTFNLKRRAITERFYGDEAKPPRSGLQTNEPPVVAPQPVAPENNPRAAEIKAAFKAGTITKEQATQQLRELGFK